MKRKTLYFTAPREVEVREETMPAPGANDVVVETLCSAISAGTEMLVYQGRFPHEIETDSVISSLRGGFRYPLAYGYACAGIVRETGRDVDAGWRDRIVFAFQPHTTHFVSPIDALHPIPAGVDSEGACFLPNMETAVNLVQDAAPLFGERVLVLGQGVIGLLTAALLAEFPLDALVTADYHEIRRKTSTGLRINASLDPNADGFRKQALKALHKAGMDAPRNRSTDPQDKFDLAFELSGNPSALNDALALTAFSGRIIIGSWYGQKQADFDLGGAFHRSRIRLISSQVSTISPELTGRWDKARRFEVSWRALRRIQPAAWITHRFPLAEAANAYRLLDDSPHETIQVMLRPGE